MENINLTKLTLEQRAALRSELEAADKQEAVARQGTYQSLKSELLTKAEMLLRAAIEASKNLNDFMDTDGAAFGQIMREYGQLKKDDQMSFSLETSNFRLVIKSHKTKEFDERADIAAERLIDFLGQWIDSSDKGSDDPMYQIAMLMLERNRKGKLDYKSISRLDELEGKFNSTEFSDIMNLFHESNVVDGTATNYYFFERNRRGVWVKLEPSFNRM